MYIVIALAINITLAITKKLNLYERSRVYFTVGKRQ